MNENPELTDVYIPRDDSSVKDAGDSLPSKYAIDIISTVRPQYTTWDIGAYEFDGSYIQKSPIGYVELSGISALEQAYYFPDYAVSGGIIINLGATYLLGFFWTGIGTVILSGVSYLEVILGGGDSFIWGHASGDSWGLWQDATGDSVNRTSSYGMLSVASDVIYSSNVRDMSNTLEKTFTVSYDVFDAGSGLVKTIEWRGDSVSFERGDSDLSWESIVSGVKNYRSNLRFVQIRVKE